MSANRMAGILRSSLTKRRVMLSEVSCHLVGLAILTNGRKGNGRPRQKEMRHTHLGELVNPTIGAEIKIVQSKIQTNIGMIMDAVTHIHLFVK